MKIAIPLSNGKLSMHFGHCEQFALVEINADTGEIGGTERLNPPAHEPGVLPAWLAELGAEVVVAGGMGMRAQSLFAEKGLKVVVGAVEENPEDIARKYAAGSLRTGANVCDH